MTKMVSTAGRREHPPFLFCSPAPTQRLAPSSFIRSFCQGSIRMKSVISCWFVAAACVLALGCGSSDGITRYRMTGSVTFNGQPVPAGTILFEPDSAAGNTGAAGSATIVDGKYDTGDQGIIGGPHIVRIDGGEKGGPNDQAGKTLFTGYTTKVDFPKKSGTHDFEVPAQAAQGGKASGYTGP
jgi:hypothetical protein